MLYELYSFQPDDRMKTDRTDTDKMKTGRMDMDRMDMDRMDMDWMGMDRMKKDRMDTDRMRTDRMDTDRMKMDRMDMDRMDMKPGRAGMKYMNEELVKTVQDCEASCEHMSHHIKRLPDFEKRFRQAVLLRDCADVCALTAKTLSRHSMVGMDTAEVCARICEACGAECAKFNDQMSQNCSRICMHCARECARFAGMRR